MSDASSTTATETSPAKKKPTWRKVIDIILDVFFGLLLVCSVVGIGFSIAQKKSPDGSLTINHHQLRYIQTGSMASNETIDEEEYKTYPIKNLPVNTIISIETIGEDHAAFYDALKVGDVITFYYRDAVQTNYQQIVVTHRIRSIVEDGKGGYVITAKGDAVTGDSVGQVIRTSEEQSSMTYIIGKVVWASYPIGATMHFLTSSWGLLFIVIIPCTVLCGYEVSKIIKMAREDHKAKAVTLQNSLSEKDQQIEEMRRRLEALEAQSKQANKPDTQEKESPKDDSASGEK